MLNITSFSVYSNLITSEAIGEGRHVYEVLIERAPQVVKLWVNGNSIEDAKGFLERRFTIKFDGEEDLTGSSLIRGKRLRSYSKKFNRRVFSDMILRQVF